VKKIYRKSKPKVRKIKKAGKKLKKSGSTEDIKEAIRANMKPAEIAEKFGKAVGAVYALRNYMKKRGQLVQKEESEPEEKEESQYEKEMYDEALEDILSLLTPKE